MSTGRRDGRIVATNTQFSLPNNQIAHRKRGIADHRSPAQAARAALLNMVNKLTSAANCRAHKPFVVH
jgi:hypothetical protein